MDARSPRHLYLINLPLTTTRTNVDTYAFNLTNLNPVSTLDLGKGKWLLKFNSDLSKK